LKLQFSEVRVSSPVKSEGSVKNTVIKESPRPKPIEEKRSRKLR